MARIQQDQTGFSVIEGLLVVIILLLVGFMGYYIYHANSKTADTYNAASNTAATPVVTGKKSADDVTLIKAAVLQYPDNTGRSKAVVTISHHNTAYALGEIADANGDGGAQWFAQKQNGAWKVVSQGADGHCDELAAHNLTSWDSTCPSSPAKPAAQ